MRRGMVRQETSRNRLVDDGRLKIYQQQKVKKNLIKTIQYLAVAYVKAVTWNPGQA